MTWSNECGRRVGAQKIDAPLFDKNDNSSAMDVNNEKLGQHLSTRQLLVIAFHYPPDNSSTGVLRTLKFTQHLRLHGWLSTVLSAPISLYRNTDTSLAETIPFDVAVHRTWAVDLKKCLSVFGVYPRFLTYPDRYWPWLFSTVRRGKSLLRSKRFHAVYSTYPIPTAHLVGLRLKFLFGLPWIADFRDPWLEDSMPKLEKWMATGLERTVVAHADRVICNTPAMRRMFLKRYPRLDAAKFVTITNGYDEPDFAALVPETRTKFQIIYPGIIDDGNRNPTLLLAGISLALSRGWLRHEDLEIVFLGCGPYVRRQPFIDDLAKYRLTELVQTHELRIPYDHALQRLAGADVLVVLSEPLGQGPDVEAVKNWTHLQVPAKVYEYLRLGRPMLALVSGGAVAELLEQTGGGRIVSPYDIEGIARQLKTFYENRDSDRPQNRALPSLISRYSRESLTQLLAAELDSVAVKRS